MDEDLTHPEPLPRAARAIERFVDNLHGLLQARALSLGIIDISISVDGWHVDAEIAYDRTPDMGFTIDARAGECRYCELVGDQSERWIDDVERSDLRVLTAENREVLDELSHHVLSGLLDARRPLLRAIAEADGTVRPAVTPAEAPASDEG